MGSLAEPRYCAMGSRCTQSRFLDGSPAQLRSTNKSELCGRCEESGLSPHDIPMFDKERIESAPPGEELKAQAFKDSLTVQLYLQRGLFWDAVRELRERRGITARKGLPPSGGDISAKFTPGRSPSEDFGTYVREWRADLWQIAQRCVPGRFQDSADWQAFISACVGLDPPLEGLDTFTRHGDLTYLGGDGRGGGRERAPMRARAPLRWAIADEKAFEDVYFWLLERVLEEFAERYLGPAGIDLEEAVQEINDATELPKQFHAKKNSLRREWHLVASDGVNANDIKKAADMTPTVREARSSGGRAPRNPVVAIQCAAFYDDHDSTGEGTPKATKRRLLAERYGLPETEVKHYVKLGRSLISGFGEINL
jgi:hypothetical protein